MLHMEHTVHLKNLNNDKITDSLQHFNSIYFL